MEGRRKPWDGKGEGTGSPLGRGKEGVCQRKGELPRGLRFEEQCRDTGERRAFGVRGEGLGEPCVGGYLGARGTAIFLGDLDGKTGNAAGGCERLVSGENSNRCILAYARNG